MRRRRRLTDQLHARSPERPERTRVRSTSIPCRRRASRPTSVLQSCGDAVPTIGEGPGLQNVTVLGMLVNQGAIAFRTWTRRRTEPRRNA